MNLYHIQDGDRPMYVVASDWQHALELWRMKIRAENAEDPVEEPIEPEGIQLVASKEDLLISEFGALPTI